MHLSSSCHLSQYSDIGSALPVRVSECDQEFLAVRTDLMCSSPRLCCCLLRSNVKESESAH